MENQRRNFFRIMKGGFADAPLGAGEIPLRLNGANGNQLDYFRWLSRALRRAFFGCAHWEHTLFFLYASDLAAL
jgi:hypothetical protein